MICITGAEKSVAALATRLEAHPSALHELRLDTLDHIDDTLWALIERHADRIVACCRPSAIRSDAERAALWLRAQTAGARYIDVEEDVGPVAGLAPERLVLSFHDFEGLGGDLVGRARSMRGRAAVVKIAISVDDVAELDRLCEVRRTIGGPAVLIAMGAAGVLSRIMPASFGSEWTYVAVSAALATAPGQLDLATAARYRVPFSGPWLGLAGGPQVAHSPGPRIYNRLLSDRGANYGYFPLITRSLAASLPLCASLGAVGLSVTMPLKAEAARLAVSGGELDAVNSLRLRYDGWHGQNTDVAGVREPLRRVSQEGGRALILGSGGAARAAAQACRELGLDVVVAARSIDRARFAPRAVPWSERAVACDVLINATPIAGDDSPWPDDVPLPAVVFDLALAPHSRLLREATAAGRITLTPLHMWAHQGAAQLRFLLGLDVTAAELERLIASEEA